MILKDHGAEVVLVSRERQLITQPENTTNEMNRGKKNISLSLNNPEHRKIVSDLFKWADVVIDPFRASVLPKFGF